MFSHDGEPTLAEAQAAYPSWHCWNATSGLYLARRVDTPSVNDRPLLAADDPLELRDQIRRAEALGDLP